MKRLNEPLRLLFATVLLILLASPVHASDLDGARNALKTGMAEEETTIELQKYGLTEAEFLKLLDEMRIRNQRPWYEDSLTYYKSIASGVVTRVEVEYLDPYLYDRKLYTAKLNNILEETVYPDMSQWQIALSIHDYLAVRYAYDEKLEMRDTYDLLVSGTGVCAGYAELYQDLLEMAGLECIQCLSEDMNHVWNMVRINGVWYHVDLTWDDPVSNVIGRVMHTYFLIDDETMSDNEHAHYAWEVYETAPDGSAMENAFWNNITSQICYESGSVSYYREDDGTMHRIYRRDESTGNVTELVAFDAGYLSIGGQSTHYYNYGLSLWNGRLYYSDMQQVYSIKTDGTDHRVEYAYDSTGNQKYICGSLVDDGMIRLTLSSADGQYSTAQISLSEDHENHVHDYQTRQVPATCEEDGYILYTCTCGDSFHGDVLTATGHQYDDGILSESGVITYTCTICGQTRTQESEGIIPPESISADPDPTTEELPPEEPDAHPRDPEPMPEEPDTGTAKGRYWKYAAAAAVLLLLRMRLSKKKTRGLSDEDEFEEAEDVEDEDFFDDDDYYE